MRSASDSMSPIIASTKSGGVNTSPWSATRRFDLTRLTVALATKPDGSDFRSPTVALSPTLSDYRDQRWGCLSSRAHRSLIGLQFETHLTPNELVGSALRSGSRPHPTPAAQRDRATRVGRRGR